MEISEYIFRAYDIRGIYNKDINPEIMYQIGLAAGTYLKQELEGQELVVGNDIRTTSVPLAYSFISGVTAIGINVFYVGTTSFGQTLFKGWELKKGAIAFITASHLPAEWNGIKFYYSDGVGFPEKELMKIRDICLTRNFCKVGWEDIGSVSLVDAKESYLNFFKERMKFSKNLKVAVDCGGASTTLSAPEIVKEIGLTLVPVFCDPDPSFSARPSDPKPKNLTELVKVVKENSCDFGVAFDGDGDRAVIVDNRGRVLSADQTGIILGKYGLKEKEGTIIVNVECSKAVDEQLKPLGFELKRIPVGHTFLTLEAKKEQSPLGIESSGHLILPEYFLFDDALVVPLKIAEILDEHEKKLSEMVDEIPIYPLKKEEVECEDDIKFKVIEQLREKMVKEYENVNTLDGVRVELEKGWVLIRPSNTSPIIRLTAEADDEEILERITASFKTRLEEEIEEYKSSQGTK
ncbi:MAG: hypothetical protein ACTSQE_13205 [Candidatus Heimdallarchaeaceae archaeon]